jgi:hypothetical protein
MARAPLTLISLLVVLGLASGQTPTHLAGSHLFIDTPEVGWGGIFKEALSPGAAQVSKVRDQLTRAGEEGYGLLLLSRRGLSLSMLLEQDGLGARAYRIVASNSQQDWLRELNEAATEGFRLVPGAAKLFNRSQESNNQQWFAVVVRQSTDERFTYTLVIGKDEDAEKGLAEARNRGASLVASFGHPFGAKLVLVLEEMQGRAPAAVASGDRQCRIISTGRIASLEAEIRARAVEGFRAIGAGASTVAMERTSGAPASPADYKLVSTRRFETMRPQLTAAGAAGFRIVTTVENANEVLLLLEGASGSVDPVEYSTLALDNEAAATALAQDEADGYRAAVLVEGNLFLERSAARTRTR